MVEPLGLSASIVGLVGFGLQVAHALNDYVESAADSQNRIKAISNDIGLTLQVFEILNDQTREDTSRKMINADAEKIAREAIRMCDDILKKLLGLLPPSSFKQRKRDVIIMLKWPFLEPKLEILRGNLEKIKATLQLLVSVISFAAMTKMHADKEVLKEKEDEIGSLLMDKMKAEADLESLKQRYHQKGVDTISSRPSSPTLGAELHSSPPGTGGAFVGATSIVGGNHSMLSISPGGEADRDISGPKDLHSQRGTSSVANSNHDLSADSDSGSDFEPVDPPYMDLLHADYSACLIQIKALQLTIEKALQKMYVPGSHVTPTANPSHGWHLRLKYTRTVEKVADETVEYLDERMIRSKVHQRIHDKADDEPGDISAPSSPVPPQLNARRMPIEIERRIRMESRLQQTELRQRKQMPLQARRSSSISSGRRSHNSRASVEPIDRAEEPGECLGDIVGDEAVPIQDLIKDVGRATEPVIPTVEDLVRRWTNLYDDGNDDSAADDERD